MIIEATGVLLHVTACRDESRPFDTLSCTGRRKYLSSAESDGSSWSGRAILQAGTQATRHGCGRSSRMLPSSIIGAKSPRKVSFDAGPPSPTDLTSRSSLILSGEPRRDDSWILRLSGAAPHHQDGSRSGLIVEVKGSGSSPNGHRGAFRTCMCIYRLVWTLLEQMKGSLMLQKEENGSEGRAADLSLIHISEPTRPY